MAFTKKPRAVRRRKPRRVGRKTKGVVSTAVKRYVRRALGSNVENKCVQINAGSNFGNVLEALDLNAYPMLPITGYWTIAQGLGQGARVGNEIKIKSIMLNYVLHPRPYDATSNVAPQPCEIDMYLGYVRGTPSSIPTSTDVNNLYQNGSSFAAPVGSLRDIVSVVNKDYWVIKKRWRHKVGYSSSNGTGALVGQQTFNNNDFKLNVVKKMNITRHVNKSVRFNDTQNTTLGKNLFFMYQAVSASGATFASTQLPMTIEFWIDVQYEDA